MWVRSRHSTRLSKLDCVLYNIIENNYEFKYIVPGINKRLLINVSNIARYQVKIGGDNIPFKFFSLIIPTNSEAVLILSYIVCLIILHCIKYVKGTERL